MTKSHYSKKDLHLVKAWSELISNHDWTFFCTFTTYYRLSLNAARAKIERMISLPCNSLGSKVDCFWVAEKHLNGSYHLHSLINTPNSNSTAPIRKAWREVSGASTTKKCNKHSIKKYCYKGAAKYYCVKQLSRSDVDYDLI